MVKLSDALLCRARSAALEQRGELLDAVWTERRACAALLPASLLPRGPTAPLQEYSAEIALAPDGTWRALRDRVGDHPGAALLEAPLLAVFLPALCRALLGQSLLLPSWPVWWWRDRATRARFAADPARFRFRDGFDPDDAGVVLATMTPSARLAVQHEADRWPERFVVTVDNPSTVRRDCKRALTLH